MHSRFKFAFSLAAMLFLAASAARAESERGAGIVQASLLADVDAAKPGESFTLGVLLKIKPGWHTYWVNPGETGNASEIHLRGPAGFEFGAIQWPMPKKIVDDGSVVYGFENELLLMVPVKVAKGVNASGSAAIDANVKWLSCKETCVEGGARLAMTLPISLEAKPSNRALFDLWKQRLPLPADHPAIAEFFGSIEQLGPLDAKSNLKFVIHWKKAPAKVEWFPISTDAAVLENVVVKQEGTQTTVTFKSTVYKPAGVPGGVAGSVVVFEDAKGQRLGFDIAVKVK